MSSIHTLAIRRGGHLNRRERRELAQKNPRLARLLKLGVHPISEDAVDEFRYIRPEKISAVESPLPMSMIIFCLGLIGIFVLLTSFTTIGLWKSSVFCIIFFVVVLGVSYVFKDIERINEERCDWEVTDFRMYIRNKPVPELVRERAMKVWSVCESSKIVVTHHGKKSIVCFPADFDPYIKPWTTYMTIALIEDGKLVE